MVDIYPLPINPDCRDGKHKACHGDAWSIQDDEVTDCVCPCHTEAAAA